MNSPITQRWKNRKHLWRPVDEGGFNHCKYDAIILENDTTARRFVEQHHYSGSYVAAVKRYGMYECDELVGIAILSAPVRDEVLTNPFPTLKPYIESLELGRFILLDKVPANGETWFLNQIWEMASRAGIRGVVSFADPVARADMHNNIIFPGHIGHIYQVAGAEYAGRSQPRTLHILPDGSLLHERMMQKIRKQESGASGAEEKLVKYGATPRRADEDPYSWLKKARTEVHIHPIKHKGNHRYLFRTDRRNRKTVHIGLPTGPYPKMEVKLYDMGTI